MTKTQTKKYTELIKKVDLLTENLSFDENEELYKELDKTEQRLPKLQNEYRKLAKEVETAIIELQVLDFLEDGHNNPDAQDVEYI